MKHRQVNLKDFSAHPGPRLKDDGPNSAEEFRENHLVPAIESFEPVKVNFEGVWGMPSSFIEEAFGGLVRKHGYSADFLYSKLTFEGDRLDIQEAWAYIRDAFKSG